MGKFSLKKLGIIPGQRHGQNEIPSKSGVKEYQVILRTIYDDGRTLDQYYRMDSEYFEGLRSVFQKHQGTKLEVL